LIFLVWHPSSPPLKIKQMGILWNLTKESFPSAPKWNTDSIPDLSGMVMIVTGGNTGLGKETVKQLLKKNAKVYLAARNKQKAEEAIAELEKETGKQAHFLELDLSRLASVKSAAEAFTKQENKLNVLFNNAGVMRSPVDEVTADGYDLQFGTNVLGTFYFTKLLLPALLSTAAETPDKKPRVITTGSMAHNICSRIQFDTLKDTPQRKKLSTTSLYGQSKFGDIVFAKELARRYGDKNIVSISLNPGNVSTDLYRHGSSLENAVMGPFLLKADRGALTQLYAGTAPEATELNGKYLVPFAKVGEPRSGCEDPEEGKKLWEWLDEQVRDL